ncbi:hypothetical protein AD929_06475 [Gluconobacter potus]|uniref:Uncharacterized protein n=1 Tax=Gluconobacter potus TaxID=2724927 RepID=A0A149QVN1_9PROT|nr:hypothetical protein AD929_06475 [Gluconobacter potus]
MRTFETKVLGQFTAYRFQRLQSLLMTFQAAKNRFNIIAFLQTQLPDNMGGNTNRKAVSPL